MSMFETSAKGIQNITPVGLEDPTDGLSNLPAKADHKHRLNSYNLVNYMFFEDSLDAGTSTVGALYGGDTDIGKALVPCRMLVTSMGIAGFNAVANQASFALTDESGNNITSHPGDVVTLDFNSTGDWLGLAIMGYKDYTIGQTMGFQHYYVVSGSNVYTRFSTKIEIIPMEYVI